MKNQIIKLCVFSLVLSLVATSADAQRTGRRRTNTTNTNTGNQTGNQQQTTEQTNSNRVASGYDPYGGIPIVSDSVDATGGAKKSLRNDGALDKSFANQLTPLPYEHLREDDALYLQRVWRELDLREKMNQTFRYAAEDDNGSQMFFNILMNAINNDSVTAWSDDRFTTPLSAEEKTAITAGGPPDTVGVRDPNDPNKIIRWQVTRTTFDPSSIMKLRIKEEWVFDREASRMFSRILGIAPVQEVERPGGGPPQTRVLFWIYYPDLRNSLARSQVYNPKNMGYGRMTWEELFESRMFSSYITKSTLDNPGNKTIRQMFPKDQILALLEGENIKERMFNYEQDLWQY